MRRAAACAAAFVLFAPRAEGQKLRDRIAGLVTFGSWTAPLQVGAPSADGRTLVPSDVFQPEGGSSPNAALLTFVFSWMQASAASAPVSSTGGGTTFSFEAGTPVAQSVTPGPIFGEYATTLGRGAVLAGASYTGVRYSKVRGVSADQLQLTFTPRSTAATADHLDLNVALDYSLNMAAFYGTVGLLDRLDVGVVVPVVQAGLRGVSTARVVSPAGARPSVLIGGTPAAPVLSSRQEIDGTATGIGDVAVRVKGNLIDRPRAALGVLGDVRFPTGDERDLLGSGSLSFRALGLYSARFGRFAPRVSAGYLHYQDANINDAYLATAGFDQDVARWATLAVSLISETQVGESKYQLPGGSPAAANIPAIRDDALSASAGVKLNVARVRGVLNVLLPVTRGGPRPDFAYTVGLERDF